MRIGILRGLMPRMAQAEFAASFSKLTPVFITGEASKEIKNYCKRVNLEHRDLALKPLWGVEPVKLVFSRRTHQSWLGLRGLFKACKDLDVLQTYELYHFFSGQAALVADRLQIPLVCEVWTSFAAHPAYFLPPYCFSVDKVKRAACLFIARSKRAAKALKEMGIAKEKIKMIYHGVNLLRFKPKGKKSSKKVCLLFVGQLGKAKGVDLLLDVWPKLIEKFSKAELWLVGEGPLAKRAKKMPAVKVFGWLSYSELPEIYQQADIFVSPSKERCLGPFLWWEEFFSYVLMEAMASGLPIVGSRCGGISEEVGNGNILIEQRDGEGLFKALERLIRDKSLRFKIGEKNRRRAERLFDLERQTRKLEEEIIKFS